MGVDSRGDWVQKDSYWLGGLLVAVAGLYAYLSPDFAIPFEGDAPEMTFAVSNRFLPHGPYVIYLWMGRLLSLLFTVSFGLALLSMIFSLVGISALIYVAFRLTGDRIQALLCGIVYTLSPVALRQAVVQEIPAVQSGLMLASLAFLLSNLERRHLISGLLFGMAVGTHPISLLALPGFLYWLFKDSPGPSRRVWAQAAGGVCLVAWIWLLYWFGAGRFANGTWLEYVLGGIGSGYGGLSISTLIPTFVTYLNFQANLLSWGVVLLGLMGLMFLVSQNRSQFWLLVLYGIPFALYQLPRANPVDPGHYVVFLAPVYALALGTAWKEGSRYLAEGLQEPLQGTLWVVAVAIVGVQAVSLFYTKHYLADSWNNRMMYRASLARASELGESIRALTQPEDIIVVIPDPERISDLAIADSPWFAANLTGRQIIFGSTGLADQEYETVLWDGSRTWGWVKDNEEKVDDALLEKYLRTHRRIFSEEPFPFLTGMQIKNRMSAIPDARFEGKHVFEILRDRRPVDDPEEAAEAFNLASREYLKRRYGYDAAACLEEAIFHLPEQKDLYRRLGDLYMALEIHNRAMEIYSGLSELDPNSEEVAVNLSGVHFELGNMDKAIEICLDFLASHPSSPLVLFNLGGYYQMTENTAAAKRAYEAFLAVADTEERRISVERILEEMEN